MTAAVTLPGFAALVTGSLGQLFSLLLQQFVQRFFYAAANQFFQLTLDYILVAYPIICYLISSFFLAFRSEIC